MPRNIDSNFCGSFAWTIVSYKLCFAALFMLTIQITIFTVRPLAEKLEGSAFCPNNLFLSRTNRELEEMSKGENIVKWLKGQRISWLGHLERMEEDRMPKKIFTQELEGTRRRGRPRKGWKEEVERDLQVF